MMAPHDAPLPTPGDPLLPLFLRVLRARGHVTFMLADLGPDRHGLVELDEGLVVLDMANTEGEHRSTIAHELEHLDVDRDVEVDGCDPDVEEAVDRAAARLLVPLQEALIVQAGADPEMVARNLGVDAPLVLARVRSLPGVGEADGGVG